MVRGSRMRMDGDREISGRNGVLGRHSGCTYIHSLCGGFHIQAHMVARTRQSHKRVQRGGATTRIRKGRTRTERGFIVAHPNSAKSRPLSIVQSFTVRLGYKILSETSFVLLSMGHLKCSSCGFIPVIENPPTPSPAAYAAASSLN